MRINTSHSETGKFKEVKICMLRNAQINWEWSLIKMTTYLLHDWVQLYFATLVVHVTPMKVTNQPVNLWSLSCGNNLLSLHSCLHHWSHSWTCIWRSVRPCSQQIATSILISKDFAWIRVVEQQCPVKYLIPVEQPAFRGKHKLFLRSGLSIRAGGPGFSPGF